MYEIGKSLINDSPLRPDMKRLGSRGTFATVGHQQIYFYGAGVGKRFNDHGAKLNRIAIIIKLPVKVLAIAGAKSREGNRLVDMDAIYIHAGSKTGEGCFAA